MNKPARPTRGNLASGTLAGKSFWCLSTVNLSGGFQVDWNGGVSGSVSYGFMWGNSTGNGSTNLSAGALAGGYITSSSGGIRNGAPNGNQFGAGISAGGGLLGGGTATLSFTNSTSFGSFVSGNPTDFVLTGARQACNALTNQY
jgi:hypothetical protein